MFAEALLQCGLDGLIVQEHDTAAAERMCAEAALANPPLGDAPLLLCGLHELTGRSCSVLSADDCGVFMTQTAAYLSQGRRLGFAQANMPYFRRRMVLDILKTNPARYGALM